MPNKFTYDDHEKKMREILKAKAEGQRPRVLQALIDKAKAKVKLGGGKPQV